MINQERETNPEEEEEEEEEGEEYPYCMACGTGIAVGDLCYQISRGFFDAAVNFHIQGPSDNLCLECRNQILEDPQ